MEFLQVSPFRSVAMAVATRNNESELVAGERCEHILALSKRLW